MELLRQRRRRRRRKRRWFRWYFHKCCVLPKNQSPRKVIDTNKSSRKLVDTLYCEWVKRVNIAIYSRRVKLVKMAFGCQTFGMVKMPLRYFKGRRYFIVKDSYFKEDEGGSSSKHVKKSQSSRSTFTMKESVVKENKKTFLLSILVFRKNQSGYYIHIHVQRMIHTYTRTCTILQLLRHPNTHSTKT